MSFNLLDLDLTDVDADTGPPQKYIEVGEHDVVVSDASMKDTKNGKGKFLEVVFSNADGKSIRENYNMVNQSDRAVQIGKSQLKAMLEASDHKDPNKPGGVDEIIGVNVRINVRLGKKREDGSQWPEVKSYEKSNGLVEATPIDDEIPF